jgi:GNAT superfamily N-acetyltransferase
MTLSLRELSVRDYARDVLPRTASLWAAGRSLERYVADIGALARTPYGRAHYATYGLYEGNRLTSSCKRYERTIAIGERSLEAVGFGAVFTPPELRGRGYAKLMLAAALDDARRRGCDVAFLFSDIAPSFYAQLGFVEMPSRSFVIAARELPERHIAVRPLTIRSLPAARALFTRGESARAWAFQRTAAYHAWAFLRHRQASEHPGSDPIALAVRGRSGLHAYVIGARCPADDTFYLDECACDGEHDAELLLALLRAAAGDLRRIGGWLPPEPVRSLLPRPRVCKRRDAVFMATALSPDGERWLAVARTTADACDPWSTDHI